MTSASKSIPSPFYSIKNHQSTKKSWKMSSGKLGVQKKSPLPSGSKIHGLTHCSWNSHGFSGVNPYPVVPIPIINHH
jgi:hypothetical protein